MRGDFWTAQHKIPFAVLNLGTLITFSVLYLGTLKDVKRKKATHRQCYSAAQLSAVCSMEPKVFLRRFFDKIHSKSSTTSRIGNEVSLEIKIIMKSQLQISEKTILKLKCCVDILWDINPNML